MTTPSPHLNPHLTADPGPDPERAARAATALNILAQRFGPGFQAGAAVRAQHGHTTTWIETQSPEAVVFVETEADVCDLVRICAAHRLPVIGFGAGTSLEGHVNAPFGGVSVDFTRMNRVISVHPEDMDCVVEPGITRKALNQDLRATGLFFPIDPGADATLGGMAATRASGTNAVRYGTMKDVVLGLRAVLPSGEVIKTAQRARKSAAGYDLTRLMIGSEGTLGLITELTLRLSGRPEAISSAICSFGDIEAACNAVIATLQYGIPVARIELLDRQTVEAVNGYSGLDLPLSPLLLLEFHGSDAGVAEQAERFGEIAAEFGSTGFEWTVSAEERSRLWQARHDAYWATLALRPGAKGISTDTCVPISRLADCMTQAKQKALAMGLIAPIVGHVGDGNFHMLLLIDMADPGEVSRAGEFIAWLNALAISMEGTCTGEHGIGQGKAGYLRGELGAPALTAMAAIKQALDPQDIFNPGKILTLGEGRA